LKVKNEKLDEQLKNKEKLYKSVNLNKYMKWSNSGSGEKTHYQNFSQKFIKEGISSGLYSEYLENDNNLTEVKIFEEIGD